jgi:hypothetical protein
MNRFTLVLIVAVVALAAAAVAGVGRPEAARGDTTTPDTVTTVGHGVVTLVPDQATVTAGVHTQAETAAAALAQNGRMMNAVIAALKQAGGKELQTQQVSLYPRTDNDGKVQGYTADNNVSATSDIAGAGPLIDAAVAAGANTVSGPSLGIADRDASYRDALGKAVDDARAKAQALAKAGGFGVGPVASVDEQVDTGDRPVFESVAAAKASDTAIEPGRQDVDATVTVSFEIR